MTEPEPGLPASPGASAQPVWDGAAWVVPGTALRWDGAAWVAGTPQEVAPPSRLLVFGQVIWRVAVLCVGGGAAVGTILMVVGLALGGVDGDTLAWVVAVPLVGGLLGVMLSGVAGPVIAGVCAWRLVPYPGARRARLLVRVLGVVIVGTLLPIMFLGASYDRGTVLIILLLWSASVAGAWFGAPWTVHWYAVRLAGRPGADR